MNEDQYKGKQKLWYVKHKGEVLGPFPSGAVRRSLLLGRIKPTDAVTLDGKNWQPVSHVPEVVPPVLRKALDEGDEAALLISRLREDTRSGRERRSAESDIIHQHRRKGERRSKEGDVINKRRAARTALMKQKKERLPLRSVLISTLLIAGIISYGLYHGAPTEALKAECDRAPVPRINWQNCRLDGAQYMSADLTHADVSGALLRGANLSGTLFIDANIEYVDFSGADLSYVQLNRARMKGANLQNADLTHAVFTGADLSFAILRGATPGGVVLKNARLDHAVWFDGGTCLAGSIGGCNRKTK